MAILIKYLILSKKFCIQYGCRDQFTSCDQEKCQACANIHTNCNLMLRSSETNYEANIQLFNRKRMFKKVINDKFCGLINSLSTLMNQNFLQDFEVSPFEHIELRKILSDLSPEERSRYIMKEFYKRGPSEKAQQIKTQLLEGFEIQLGELISKFRKKLRQQQLKEFYSSAQGMQDFDFYKNQVSLIWNNEKSVIEITKKHQTIPREKKPLVFLNPSINKCTKVMFRICKKCWSPCIGIFSNKICLKDHEELISENYTSSNCSSNPDKKILEDKNEYRLLQFDYDLGDIIQLHYFQSQNLIRISINRNQRYYFLQVPANAHTWFWGLRFSSEEAMMELLR